MEYFDLKNTKQTGITVLIIAGLIVGGGVLGWFGNDLISAIGDQKTTVNVQIASDFDVETWDGVKAQYIDRPDYFVNLMILTYIYFDTSFIEMAEDIFEENGSAVLDSSTIDNESIGFGFASYYIPFTGASNSSLNGISHSLSMPMKIMIVSVGLSITNTTDDFEVEGGLENQTLFFDALMSETMNKTIFDDYINDVFFDGTFNVILTGCQYFDASTSRVFSTVNGKEMTFDSDFAILFSP